MSELGQIKFDSQMDRDHDAIVSMLKIGGEDGTTELMILSAIQCAARNPGWTVEDFCDYAIGEWDK